MSSFSVQEEDEWVVPSDTKKSKRRGKREAPQVPLAGAWTKPLDSDAAPAVEAPQTNERAVPVVTEIEQQSSFAFSKNKVIVVDTGAIVYRAVSLERFGSEFVTTAEVLTEIRDSKSKYILSTLPFELKVREPTRDSLKFVSEYAKRTGDFANLSGCDLGILALTYEIETEINGSTNIKPLPEDLGITGYKKVILRPYSDLYKKKGEEGEDEDEQDEEQEEHEHSEEQTEEIKEDKPVTEPTEEKQTETEGAEVQNSTEEVDEEEEDDSEEYDSSDEECNDEWITPDNLQEHKKKQIGPGGVVVNSESWDEEQKAAAATTSKHHVQDTDDEGAEVRLTEETEEEGRLAHNTKEVGCITVDFSMQNVLLHMGLNLVSIDGRRIKYLTRYVKRCYGCSTLVPDTSRIFCPNCGIDTLLRVTCIVDSATGEANFYFNPKKKLNFRGSKFPLPLPKGGRNNRDPILCEDQLARFKRGMPRKKDQVLSRRNNPNDPNNIWQPEYSFEGGFQSKPSKGRYHLGRNTAFNGYGRRNPNEVVKRTGKKKKSNRVL